jgi:cytochrome bd-type quinol oxidase subunit 2
LNSLFGHLTHFETLTLFSVVVSLIFAFQSKDGARDRLTSFLWTLAMFLVAAVGIGWLMFPFSR